MTRARGTGSVFQARYKDRQGAWRTASTWTLQYYDRRKRDHVTEGGFKTEEAAGRKLRRYLADQDRGVPTGPAVERTSFGKLEELITNDYVNNEHDSLPRLKQSLAHLRKAFGRLRAWDITDDRVEAYKAARKSDGAMPATINRELAALKRMFKLARKLIPVPPTIELLAERNRRTGFFEEEQFRAVLAKLPEYVRAVAQVAYITGWRVPSEILTREWRHVDFAGGWLILEPGEAKSEEPRRFPLDPQLRPILQPLHDAKKAFQQEHGRVVPWVFYRVTKKTFRVRRIGSFYKVWHQACREAGIAGRIPHDFRRTAFRNLRRKGVDVLRAMELVGWSSFAMAKRYGGVSDEASLREAAEKLGNEGGW